MISSSVQTREASMGCECLLCVNLFKQTKKNTHTHTDEVVSSGCITRET